MASIDLKARQIIMASWLYYEKNISIISDAEFDALCQEVADDLEWFEMMGESEIDPVRRIQLGSADQLRASGFHIKVTQLSIYAACSWFKSKNRRRKPIIPVVDLKDFKEDPDTGVLMRGILG